MYHLLSICLIYLLGAVFLYYLCNYKAVSARKTFLMELIILFISIYLHLFLAILSPNGDSVFLSSVTKQLVEKGFAGFYDNAGITYPPLFNYLFFIIGKILSALQIPLSWSYRSFIFAGKLPGICCEFFMAFLIYKNAQKYLPETKRVLALYLILLNPGYYLVTSYICQFDALYSFFVLLTIYLITNCRLKTAYFTFAVAILFKFQALFIAPVLIFAIIDQVILQNFSWKCFFIHLAVGLSAIACMALSYVPFINPSSACSTEEPPLIHNFSSSVSGYGRASTNAYNFWTLIGRNLHYDSEKLGPVSCLSWAILFIILIVVLSIFIFFKGKRCLNLYPMTAALLIAGIYCFSVRMMARYLYPALVLIFLGYTMKPSKKRFICSISFSIAYFINTWGDYMLYPYNEYNNKLILPYIASAYMISCFVFLIYTLLKEITEKGD